MSLSQNIKRLRTEKGLTQEQLASTLGVSSQAVSKWETSETYPDGALLVPLANTLDTSLDELFDNKAYSMKDLSSCMRNLISSTPANERFHLIRDMCWQIEKGLFNCRMAVDECYDPKEIKQEQLSSYILNEHGFTHLSNGRAPFFSVFPDSENGFSEVIGDGEEMRILFEALASPETMRAVIFIHQNEPNYVFEAEVLADKCNIEADKLEEVMKNLMLLHVVSKYDLEIDSNLRTLYSSHPSHKIIALLLFAHEINYTGGYRYQAHHRNTPYLK